MEKIDIPSFVRRNKKGKTSRVKAAKRALSRKSKKPSKLGKLLGEGKNGKVFEVSRNKVYKERTPAGVIKGEIRSALGGKESIIQTKAYKAGVAPRVLSSGKRDRWIVMERIKGEPLSKKLPTISERQQKDIGKKTGKSLKKLHRSKIIHNDTHLDNLYSTKKGEVKILDYGLSRYKSRPLKKREKLKDYKKLRSRSSEYPAFIDGFEAGYGNLK